MTVTLPGGGGIKTSKDVDLTLRNLGIHWKAIFLCPHFHQDLHTYALTLNTHKCLLNVTGARGFVQWLIALTALVEDQGLASNTHMEDYNLEKSSFMKLVNLS